MHCLGYSSVLDPATLQRMPLPCCLVSYSGPIIKHVCRWGGRGSSIGWPKTGYWYSPSLPSVEKIGTAWHHRWVLVLVSEYLGSRSIPYCVFTIQTSTLQKLSPLLFIIYRLRSVKDCRVLLYGDDTCIYASAQSPTAVWDKLSVIFNSWPLGLEMTWCRLVPRNLSFCFNINKSHLPIEGLQVEISRSTLHWTDKYVGVLFDSDMSWEPHITLVLKKCSCTKAGDSEPF